MKLSITSNIILLSIIINDINAWLFGGFGGYGQNVYARFQSLSSGWNGGLNGFGSGIGFPYGYGLGYRNAYYNSNFFGKRSALQMEDKIVCIFSSKDKIITCNNGLVTCDTMPQFKGINYRFDMFGIQLVDKNSVFLFPKNFTDNSFSDSKTMIDNKEYNFSLFTQDSDSKGLQVKETACFNKLVDLLSSVQNPVQADALINKQSTKVSISGVILGF